MPDRPVVISVGDSVIPMRQFSWLDCSSIDNGEVFIYATLMRYMFIVSLVQHSL